MTLKRGLIIMKAFRIIGRGVRDAFKSIFRNFSLSLASISCITITLLIVAISMIFSYNAENISTLIKKDFSIVVFIDNDATDEEVESIKGTISKMNNIDKYEYESKDMVAKKFKDSSPTYAAIVDNWKEGENPLSDVISIKVKDATKINETADEIKEISKIETVEYGEGMVEQILTILETLGNFLVGIVIALVLVTVFLVNNTIKLTIFSRKKEVEIMRLVGASNFNVKLPFVIEGIFIGILGSAIPIGLITYGYNQLYEYFSVNPISPFIQLVSPLPFVYLISLILLGMGVVVGAFGSASSVRKYLKI